MENRYTEQVVNEFSSAAGSGAGLSTWFDMSYLLLGRVNCGFGELLAAMFELNPIY